MRVDVGVLVLSLSLGLSWAQYPCRGGGNQLSRSGKAFYACDEDGQAKFTGCADENRQFVADGAAFNYTDSSGHRFRLLCSIEDSIFESSQKATLLHCYDVEGKKVEQGQTFAWYNPAIERKFGKGVAGFTMQCTGYANDSFSAKSVACAGLGGIRVEFGETYTPFPESRPELAFVCRLWGERAVFNERLDCSEGERFQCTRNGDDGAAGPNSPLPCVKASWRCDGDNDCGNGADEEDCPSRSRASSLADLLARLGGGGGGSSRYPCDGSGKDQMTKDKTAFYRCDDSGQAAFTGCVDEAENFVPDGAAFNYTTKQGDRYLLRCFVNNGDGSSSQRADLIACYAQDGGKFSQGETFAFYNPRLSRIEGTRRYAGFLRRCEDLGQGKFGAKTVACAGLGAKRIEYGENYTPFPEARPELTFECRKFGTRAAFNVAFDCSDSSETWLRCTEGRVEKGPSSPRECVPTRYRCDGDDDCGNGRDEEGCPSGSDRSARLRELLRQVLGSDGKRRRRSTEADKLFFDQASISLIHHVR